MIADRLPYMFKGVSQISINFCSCPQKGWICHSINIKSAFLQRNYCILKEPFTCDLLLNIAVEQFGNCGKWFMASVMPCAQYLRVKWELSALSMRVCNLDPTLFYCQWDDDIHGIICLHVDDFSYRLLLQCLRYILQVNSDNCFLSGLMGQWIWIATQVRPGIAFEVCELSLALSQATIGDLLKLTKCFGGSRQKI